MIVWVVVAVDWVNVFLRSAHFSAKVLDIVRKGRKDSRVRVRSLKVVLFELALLRDGVHLREEDCREKNSGHRHDGDGHRRIVILDGGEVVDDGPCGENRNDENGCASDPASFIEISLDFQN